MENTFCNATAIAPDEINWIIFLLCES